MSKKAEPAVKKNDANFFSKNRFETILFAVTFLVFVNSILNKYSLDDELVTERNTQVSQGIGGIKTIFTSFYTEGSDTKYSFEYRPVVKATYAIEYSLFGFNPTISHLINILLYAITIVVLFRFLSFLFKNTNPLFSFLVCLLFAVHPLHTEVVASLKNRDELLSLLFCLLTAKYAFDFMLNKKWIAIPLAVICFFVAALSKRDALVFLGIIPLMGIYFYRKEIKWVLIIPAIILPWGVQSLMRNFAVNKVANDRVLNFHENPLFGDFNLMQRIAMASKSFGFYLKIFFIPYPLCFYYGYNQVTIPPFASVGFILPVLVGVFILWVIFKFFKSSPLLSFGLAFFVVSISIYLNIIMPAVGIVADRFDYVPGLGLCIAFVAALGMVFKVDFSKEKKISFAKLKPALSYSLIAICIVFSVCSMVRNRQWKSRMSLFAHDIKHLNNSAKANELLASQYSAEASQSQEPQQRNSLADSAIKYFKRTLEIYPDYITVYNNLGSIYFNMKGDLSTPLQYFKKAIE
ncbi:MAG: hypothetical protein IAF38_04055, partial [Bacteroidia bacterium]|nr:hypothetical protein [Bacteroidia bacterium]